MRHHFFFAMSTELLTIVLALSATATLMGQDKNFPEGKWVPLFDGNWSKRWGMIKFD